MRLAFNVPQPLAALVAKLQRAIRYTPAQAANNGRMAAAPLMPAPKKPPMSLALCVSKASCRVSPAICSSPAKDHLAEMRDMGVRGVLIYCADYRARSAPINGRMI